MAYYSPFFQDTKRRFESPAKVFAELKSKVQEEEKRFTGNVREDHRVVFSSPRKTAESTQMTYEENLRSGSYRNEAQALTLSPTSRKIFGYPDIGSKHVEEVSPFVTGRQCTPRKKALLGSTTLSHLSSPVNRQQVHTELPQVGDSGGFKVMRMTPVNIQPVENDFLNSVFDEWCAPPDKPMSRPYMSSPTTKSLKQGKGKPQEFNIVSNCTEEVSKESLSQPQERKTCSPFIEGDITSMDLHLGNVRGFPSHPSEMNQFTHEPMFPSLRSIRAKRSCDVVEEFPLKSPAKIFAYMKKRESKMKQQEVHKVSCTARDLFDKGNFLQSRDTLPPSTAPNMAEMEDIVCRSVASVSQSRDTLPPSTAPNMAEMEDIVCRSVASVSQSRDTLPPSTAPNMAEMEDIVCRSVASVSQSRDTLPPSTAPNMAEMEDIVCRSVASVSQSREADSQSNADPSDLLEDPLILNTPQISIPKKAVFKRKKRSRRQKIRRLGSAIYLKKWFLGKNHKGLFVEGIHSVDNIQWYSTSIVDRVSNSVVQTINGSVYVLVGKMSATNSALPKWLLKKFANGFPSDWKALYKRFLSEETERNNKGKSVMSKTNLEASSMIRPETRQKQKSTKTPESCPPALLSRVNMSRSGRVIKPPLEYWKGGRVILDAHMNVTVHECYETSICIPVTPTVSMRTSQKTAFVFLPFSEGRKQSESALSEDTVPQKQTEPEKSSTRRSKIQTHNTACPSERVLRSSRVVLSSPSPHVGVTGIKRRDSRQRNQPQPQYVFPSSSEESDSASDEEASVPLKAPLGKGNSAEVEPKEHLSYLPEPPVETLSRPRGSNQRRPAAERSFYADIVPQKQNEPEKSSTQRSKRQTRNTKRPTWRELTSKQAVPSPSSSSVDEVIGRKKPGKVMQKKRGRRVLNKSQPSYEFPSSDSSNTSDKSENEFGKSTNITQTTHRQSECTKSSSPTKPKSTQSSKKKPNADKGNAPNPQEEDADKWTDSELMKLQEAVSYYPNHMAGYWAKVAKVVGTRSAEECHSQHTSKGAFKTPAKRGRKPKKKVEAPKVGGSEESDSASEEEASVPLKAPLGKRNSAEVEPKEHLSSLPEPPVETLSRPRGSNQRRPAAERSFYADIVPQKQNEPEKSSTQRSKRQTRNTKRPTWRELTNKQAVPSPSSSSVDEVIGRKKPGKVMQKKRGRRVLNKSQPSYAFPSSDSSNTSDKSENEFGKSTNITQTTHRQSECTKSSSPAKPKSTQSSKKKPNADKGNAPNPQEEDADKWTDSELMKLQEAVSYYPNHMAGYWAKVAKVVGTRSAEECHSQHTSKGAFKTPAKRGRKPKKKVEAPKVGDLPVISAGVGTYKRKQQVRQFLEAMPREDVEDVFSSSYMQSKRFEMPSMGPSDHDFITSEMEPLSPMSTGAKTPQCLHITPGMMGSPNRNNGDKYVFQLQKRMKKNQFNVCKQAPSAKRFTPTPSAKRTMKRCDDPENDTFIVLQKFPGNDCMLSDSEEEEDYYF